MNNLHYDINELQQQYTIYFQVLDQYTNQLEDKLCELKSFVEDDSSTSATLSVLKANVNRQVIVNLEKIVEIFSQIKLKLNQVKEYYLSCCGEMSLDENDLIDNIKCVKQIISYYEDLEHSLHLTPEVYAQQDVAQILDQLHQLHNLYQNKIDSMYEFEQTIAHMFDNEIEELREIQLNMSELKALGGNPLVNILSMSKVSNRELTGEQIQEKLKSMTLEEQEKLIGSSYNDFKNLYISQYGFNEEEIKILWKIKMSIAIRYDNGDGLLDATELKRVDLEYMRLMGRITYNSSSDKTSFAWDQVVGQPDSSLNQFLDALRKSGIPDIPKNLPLTSDILKDYLMTDLGLSKQETDFIYYRIRIQNQAPGVVVDFQPDPDDNSDDKSKAKSYLNPRLRLYLESLNTSNDEINRILNQDFYSDEYQKVYNNWKQMVSDKKKAKVDFSHFQITMLANELDKPQWIKDYAGWKGDLYGIPIVGKPSCGELDFYSDIDALNIIKLKNEKGLSQTEAERLYYQQINSGEINRTGYFLENNPHVINQINHDLYSLYLQINKDLPVERKLELGAFLSLPIENKLFLFPGKFTQEQIDFILGIFNGTYGQNNFEGQIEFEQAPPNEEQNEIKY